MEYRYVLGIFGTAIALFTPYSLEKLKGEKCHVENLSYYTNVEINTNQIKSNQLRATILQTNLYAHKPFMMHILSGKRKTVFLVMKKSFSFGNVSKKKGRQKDLSLKLFCEVLLLIVWS